MNLHDILLKRMRKRLHPIQMKIQKAVLICLLSGSSGVLAHAQTPDLSLPPLPSLDAPTGSDAPSLPAYH